MCILNWKTQIYDFFCQVCLIDTFTSKIDQLRLVYYEDKKFQPKAVTNYKSVEKFIEHVSVLDSAYDAGQFIGGRVVTQKLQQIFFESSKSFFRAQYEEACKSKKIQSFEYIDFVIPIKIFNNLIYWGAKWKKIFFRILSSKQQPKAEMWPLVMV